MDKSHLPLTPDHQTTILLIVSQQPCSWHGCLIIFPGNGYQNPVPATREKVNSIPDETRAPVTYKFDMHKVSTIYTAISTSFIILFPSLLLFSHLLIYKILLFSHRKSTGVLFSPFLKGFWFCCSVWGNWKSYGSIPSSLVTIFQEIVVFSES